MKPRAYIPVILGLLIVAGVLGYRASHSEVKPASAQVWMQLGQIQKPGKSPAIIEIGFCDGGKLIWREHRTTSQEVQAAIEAKEAK